MDPRMAFFRIPARPLIRFMGHVLQKWSFTPFSKVANKLKPFEHCTLIRQALNSLGVKGCKLLVLQDRDLTLFKTFQDFHSSSISWKGPWLLQTRIYYAFPFSTSPKRKQRSASRPLDLLLSIYMPPSMTYLKRHKEDNIQEIVSIHFEKGRGILSKFPTKQLILLKQSKTCQIGF